jgi:hypothetical protein
LGYSNSELKGSPIKQAEAKAKVQQDYARVDVYFQTLNVKSIVQTPTYPVSIIISSYNQSRKKEIIKFKLIFFREVHWFQILVAL